MVAAKVLFAALLYVPFIIEADYSPVDNKININKNSFPTSRVHYGKGISPPPLNFPFAHNARDRQEKAQSEGESDRGRRGRGIFASGLRPRAHLLF